MDLLSRRKGVAVPKNLVCSKGIAKKLLFTTGSLILPNSSSCDYYLADILHVQICFLRYNEASEAFKGNRTV